MFIDHEEMIFALRRSAMYMSLLRSEK